MKGQEGREGGMEGGRGVPGDDALVVLVFNGGVLGDLAFEKGEFTPT